MAIKWILWIAGIVLALFVALTIAIQLPVVHDFALRKVENYFNDKTGGVLKIEDIDLRLPGYVALGNIKLYNQSGIKLLSLDKIEVSVGWRKFFVNEIRIDRLRVAGLDASIWENQAGVWNYQWVVDGFATSDTTASATDSSASWEVVVNLVQLESIDLRYGSDRMGDSLQAVLQSATVIGENVSLTQQIFEVSELELNKAEIFYRLASADTTLATDTLSSAPLMIKTALENLLLAEVKVEIEMPDSAAVYKIAIDELAMASDKVDVASNSYRISTLSAQGLRFDGFAEPSNEETAMTYDIFAPIDLVVDRIDLSKITVLYREGSTSLVDLKDFALESEDLIVNDSLYALKLKSIEGNFNAIEIPDQVSAEFALSPKRLSIPEFYVKSGKSFVEATADIRFAGIQNFVETAKVQKARLNAKAKLENVNDLRFLGSILPIDSIASYLPDQSTELIVDASTRGEAIDLSRFRLSTGNTSLVAKGVTSLDFKEMVTISSLSIDFSKSDFTGLFAFMELDSLPIPENIDLRGSGSFRSNKLKAEADISSRYGEIHLLADGLLAKSGRFPMTVKLLSDSLVLSHFIDPAVDISSDLDLFLSVSDIKDTLPDVKAVATITAFQYGKTEVQNIAASGQFTYPSFSLDASVRDSFLVATVSAFGRIDPDIYADFETVVEGVDLRMLGLAEKDIRGAFKLKGNYQLADSSQSGAASFSEITLVNGDRRYDLEPITAAFVFSEKDSTRLNLKSSLFDLSSIAYGTQSEIQDAWLTLLTGEADSLKTRNAYWELDFKITDDPELRELLLPQLTRVEDGSGYLVLHAAKDKFEAAIDLPGIVYGSYQLDSLEINAKTAARGIQFDARIGHISVDNLAIENISIASLRTALNSRLRFEIDNPFTEGVDLKILGNLKRKAAGDRSLAYLQLDTLQLADKDWTTDSVANTWNFQSQSNDLVFTTPQKGQSIEINSKPKELRIDVKAFDLANLGQILATPINPLKGRLSANVLSLPEGELKGSGQLTNLDVAGFDLGKITFEVESDPDYTFASVNGKGDDLNFNFSGSQKTVASDQILDFSGKVVQFNLDALPLIASDFISESSGIAEANFALNGNVNNPIYTGDVRLRDASLRAKANGALYRIENEKVKLESDKLVFDTFTLLDSAGNALKINGFINHDDLSLQDADFNINANNFQIIDLKRANSPMLFGKVFIDADISVKGNLSAPRVDSKLKITQGTDLSYALDDESDIEEISEDLLVWIEEDQSADSLSPILLRSKVDKTITNIFEKTLDFSGALEIDKAARFTVIVDTVAGDYLTVRGGGKLAVNYDRAGNLKLNGTYEVTDGLYQLTLYDVIKKKFDIDKGSVIIWNGDAMDASLNIKATYRTKAGISNLLSSDNNTSGNAALSQQLPFEIAMKIEGELNDPLINFELRLADASKGALGGAVEARLNQINENENDRNKQVVALLVFNTFLSSGGGGSDNLVANQARNSASKILTNQLNALSNKLVAGVDLNFDLESYGGGAGKGNTDLNIDLAKSFFDERVVVRVGSTVALESSAANSSSNNIMTNVVIEYKITDDGRYRFKVYSKTDLEDIVVGRITRTGVGVLFHRDFDQWRYLLKADPVIPSLPDKETPEEPKEDDREEGSEDQTLHKPEE